MMVMILAPLTDAQQQALSDDAKARNPRYRPFTPREKAQLEAQRARDLKRSDIYL